MYKLPDILLYLSNLKCFTKVLQEVSSIKS